MTQQQIPHSLHAAVTLQTCPYFIWRLSRPQQIGDLQNAILSDKLNQPSTGSWTAESGIDILFAVGKLFCVKQQVLQFFGINLCDLVQDIPIRLR